MSPYSSPPSLRCWFLCALQISLFAPEDMSLLDHTFPVLLLLRFASFKFCETPNTNISLLLECKPL
jgi:hypothetical protein